MLFGVDFRIRSLHEYLLSCFCGFTYPAKQVAMMHRHQIGIQKFKTAVSKLALFVSQLIHMTIEFNNH